MLSTRAFAARSAASTQPILSKVTSTLLSTTRPTINPAISLTSSIPVQCSSAFHTSMPTNNQQKLTPRTISEITHKESQLTGQPQPVKGGPTARAQKHVKEALSRSKVVSDITKGEETITHHGGPVPGGPAAFVISQANQAAHAAQQTHASKQAEGSQTDTLDAGTISRITHAESQLTGRTGPVRDGPTAQAQKHVGEPIGRNLHDIDEAEKDITGGDRVKGGPTAAAQSDLSKSRS